MLTFFKKISLDILLVHCWTSGLQQMHDFLNFSQWDTSGLIIPPYSIACAVDMRGNETHGYATVQ